MDIGTLFQIIILIFSVVIHEYAHGYVADRLGDPTPRYQGRLTLNPLPHLDMFGSIILPFLLVVTGAGFIIGWAKPVIINPYNLKNSRWGELLVAMAGPASNLLIAAIFGLIIRSADFIPLSTSFFEIAFIIVFINVLLAVFNLVPIPPLDGSKILFALFPKWAMKYRRSLEQYGFFLVLLFIVLLWQYVLPIISFLSGLFSGVWINFS